MAHPGMLNVREHLERMERFAEAFKQYGDCPAIREELAGISLINRAILQKHEAKREQGERKDIRFS